MVRTRTTSVNPPPSDAPRRAPANVLFRTWLVSRAATAAIDDALADSGLSADEFAAYSVLAAGPVAPGELARWMSAPATTVSSYVKRFEARGHVRREPNPVDRRSYRLVLTDDGRAAHRAAGEAFLPVLERVEADLGPRREDVAAALAHLAEALGAPVDAPDGPGGPDAPAAGAES